MDIFAKETPDTRAEIFRETAARMNVTPAIAEKDFWVCWTLKRVFELGEDVPGLLFKGGTSLSKAYGAIRRFSEDIDLSLDRHDLGFDGDRDPAADLSGKQRKALLEDLETAAAAAVAGPVQTALAATMAAALGESVDLKPDDDPQTLIFTYPKSLQDGPDIPAYIPPSVRLEFGARSDHLPFEDRPVTSYAAEHFPDLFSDPSVTVKTLAAERTFWEKATILHMLYHRDPDKPLALRMSRHYYDLVQLSRTAIKSRALETLDLLKAVADHKAVFFKANWARYDTAIPPTLRLTPSAPLRQALETDYQRMGEMLFDAPEAFDALMDTLSALETEINASA